MQQHSSRFEALIRLQGENEPYKREAEILGAVVRGIAASQGHVTNKAVILHLLSALESSSDSRYQDELRNTLALVIGHASDEQNV